MTQAKTSISTGRKFRKPQNFTKCVETVLMFLIDKIGMINVFDGRDVMEGGGVTASPKELEEVFYKS